MNLMKLLAPAAIASAAAAMILGSCTTTSKADSTKGQFVTIDSTGHFRLGDSAYRFIGTNFWYGAILGSEGQGGDRQRLIAELDTLHSLGLDNLRILVGGDGSTADNTEFQISPTLQIAPGVYNDTILEGLDFLLAELEKRDMKAVLYLNNAWEWSGGYGKYLEWAGHGKCPMPNTDGYQTYVDHASHFVTCDTAKSLYYDHVRNIVGRISSISGKPYSESPAIMSWQICNEPRPFARANKEAMIQWLDSTARLIKSIDPNHLVSTGSEGKYGCEVDIDAWVDLHTRTAVDYATIHVWPYNWGWVRDTSTVSGLPRAIEQTHKYIREHVDALKDSPCPLVLEEFGYPRDSMALAIGSPVTARETYYGYVLSYVKDSLLLDGANFWGWGGLATPRDAHWAPGDPYTGDPAQEPQGLNSVYAADGFTFKAD